MYERFTYLFFWGSFQIFVLVLRGIHERSRVFVYIFLKTRIIFLVSSTSSKCPVEFRTRIDPLFSVGGVVMTRGKTHPGRLASSRLRIVSSVESLCGVGKKTASTLRVSCRPAAVFCTDRGRPSESILLKNTTRSRDVLYEVQSRPKSAR